MGEEDEKNNMVKDYTIFIEEKRELKMPPKKDLIPEEIPKEKNNHIDDKKIRRSSLRRSTNGDPGATFRAACAAVDPALPPKEKMRKITELCLNQTLKEIKINALETEQDALFMFSESLRSKMDEVLQNVQDSAGDKIPDLKQDTQTKTAIKQMKEERSLWNEEFKKRREAYLEARNKLKDVLKGKVCIETARLKSEDVKFLNNLPDFAAINERIVSYKNRHYIGMIHLEKQSQRIYRSLATVEQKLDEVQHAIVPTFQWP